MVKKIEDLNYYELLEVNPSASSQDIHRAYERVRRVYEPNSIALYSLFTPEETAAIHQRIEDAYRTLVYEDNRKKYDAMLRNKNEFPEAPPQPAPAAPVYQAAVRQPALSLASENRYLNGGTAPTQAPAPAAPTSPEEASPVTPFIAEFTGPAVKALREQRGLSLRAVSDATKVSLRYLECIEGELYTKLPARPYLRGFLVLYAKALGMDPERMVNDYLKRYDAATGKIK